MKIRHLTALVLLASTALGSAACSADRASAAPETAGATKSPTPHEAVAGAALVLDVRSKEEFDGGHLANAENIPVDEVESKIDAIAQRLGGDRTKPIAVYCASGGRAGRAQKTLEKAGFTQVTNAGGYRDLE